MQQAIIQERHLELMEPHCDTRLAVKYLEFTGIEKMLTNQNMIFSSELANR